MQRPAEKAGPERPKPASAGFGQRNFNRGEFIPLSSHSVNMGKPVFIQKFFLRSPTIPTSAIGSSSRCKAWRSKATTRSRHSLSQRCRVLFDSPLSRSISRMLDGGRRNMRISKARVARCSIGSAPGFSQSRKAARPRTKSRPRANSARTTASSSGCAANWRWAKRTVITAWACHSCGLKPLGRCSMKLRSKRSRRPSITIAVDDFGPGWCSNIQ